MPFLSLGENWGSHHSGAVVGILILENITIPANSDPLKAIREETEADLRGRFPTRADLDSHPILQHYKDYYKQFKKSYHVRFQLESVAQKGKSIPHFNPLVEAMFIAELQNLLLTAGHDLDQISLPLTLDLSSGDETYTLLSGQTQHLKAKDMYMADQQGIVSSVIYGPDNRTKISPQTKNALFVAYATPGISPVQVTDHLDQIAEHVALFSPVALPSPIETVQSP